jgi:hypothetical protein
MEGAPKRQKVNPLDKEVGLPISERSNDISEDMDLASPLEFVRILRQGLISIG